MSSKSSTSAKKLFQNPFVTMQEKAKKGSQVLSASVRRMQTRRPFTPSDGDNFRSNSIECLDKRPFSGFKFQRSSSHKTKGADQTQVLKLEPIVTAARPVNVQVKETHIETGSHSLPSSLPPIIVNNNDETKSIPGYLIRSDSQSSDIFIPVESFELLAHTNRSDKNYESANVSVKLENLLPQLEKLCASACFLASNTPSPEKILHAVPGSDVRSVSKSVITSLTNTLEGEVSGNAALPVIDELYKILDESCILGTSFEHRYTILKLLFKLLDLNFPKLTLHIAKAVLGIRVSGKNLMHICKAIYRVSMDSSNDLEFIESQLLEPFLKAVKHMDAIVDSDALLYSLATTKFLSANQQLLIELYNTECPSVLLHHLSDIVALIPGQSERKELTKILTQLITTMRNMAENEIIRDTFVNNGSLPKLLVTLQVCSSDSQVVLPTIRLISKVVEESRGCDAIKTCDDIFSTFTTLFKIYNFHLDVIVRLGYIVGSLVSADCDSALKVYLEQDFLPIVYTTLCDYVHMDIKRKEIGLKTIVYKEKLFDFSEMQWEQDVPDVIVKMVRILANMCLNSDVGHNMALDKKCIMCFVQIIDAYKILDILEEGSWVPFLSILMALNNITYFMPTNPEMSSHFKRLAHCIFPVLSGAYDLQVRLEACLIIGNLTRSAEIRSFILHNKLLPSVVALLDENDHEMLYVAYGVMMNILIDNSMRTAFYEANGIVKLFHQLHLCLSRDWKMVSLLCQILWNYCGGSEASLIPLSSIEVQHLVKVLTYSAKSGTVEQDSGDASGYEVWSKEFCPVATELLRILKENPCMSKHTAL